MNQIQVLDKRNKFHTFEGDNISYFITPDGCEIVDFDGENNKNLAFFKDYEWVKRKAKQQDNVEQPKPQPVQTIPVDEFTQQDLEARTEKKLDPEDLKAGAPIDIPEEKPEKEFCGQCNNTGTVPDPESDDPLDTLICPEC